MFNEEKEKVKHKIVLSVLVLASAVTLAACQKETSKTSTKASTTQTSQKSTASSSRSSSSGQEQETSSSTESKKTQIDLAAIASGDYTSVVGTWKNAKGSTLIVDATGQMSLNGNTHVSLSSVTNEGNYISASQDNELSYFQNLSTPFFIIPAGVPITVSYVESDSTDNTKDRMFATQGGMPAETLQQEAYYKVSNDATIVRKQSQSVEEAKQRTDTGVTLSGGDSSVAYANKILGYKERMVTHGNYGMTDGISYNTVTSKDGQVYVYQNGVIISEDNQIMFEP